MTSPAFWQDQPILVTGAGGFIAGHLVEALLVLGDRVRAFIRYNSRGDLTEVIETNMIGTLNILLAGHQAVIERLVHTSTSEVYGTAQLPGVHLTFLDEKVS